MAGASRLNVVYPLRSGSLNEAILNNVNKATYGIYVYSFIYGNSFHESKRAAQLYVYSFFSS